MNWKLYIRQYIKMAAQNLYLPAVYMFSLRKKPSGEKKMILFADAHHDRCPESMRLLRQALRRKDVRICELYLDYQKASFRQTLVHMTRFMRLYACADAVVICDNFLPAAGCRKREGTKVLQLWHACGALKRFGYDTEDDIPSSYRGNVFRNIDRVTVSSPECAAPFAAAMRLPLRAIWPAGVSRTDRYFRKKWKDEMTRRFYELLPEAAGKKVIVWAPTFRAHPGAPERAALDLEKLAAQLGEEYLIIEKQHPHLAAREEAAESKAASQTPEKGCAQLIRQIGMSTEELFPVTDVLIADYSSLIYEYLLFDRPLVLYIPDFSAYAGKRGFYMNYDEIPGERVTEESALAQAVRDAAGRKTADDGLRSGQAFLDKWMCACDGHSTERIASYLLDPE